jgi:hypothetical protein
MNLYKNDPALVCFALGAFERFQQSRLLATRSHTAGQIPSDLKHNTSVFKWAALQISPDMSLLPCSRNESNLRKAKQGTRKCDSCDWRTVRRSRATSWKTSAIATTCSPGPQHGHWRVHQLNALDLHLNREQEVSLSRFPRLQQL